MPFYKRLSFYLMGFAIGLIFVLYIFNNKKTRCNYGPQARVKYNLSLKSWEKLSSITQQINLDSVSVAMLLTHSDVIFSKSNVKLDSCKFYYLESTMSEKEIFLEVRNCKNKVVIVKMGEIEKVN